MSAQGAAPRTGIRRQRQIDGKPTVYHRARLEARRQRDRARLEAAWRALMEVSR